MSKTNFYKKILISFVILFTIPNFVVAEDSLKSTADILFLEGKEEEALPLYQNWLSNAHNITHPQFSIVLFRVTSCLKDPYQAIKCINHYLPQLTQPKAIFQAHYFVASQYDMCGDFDNAAVFYKKTLALLEMPNFDSFLSEKAELTYRLAAVQAEMGYLSEAATNILPIVEKSADNNIRVSAIMLYSRLLTEQGQIGPAIQAASLVFPFYKGDFPQIVYYWLQFLVSHYPKESESLLTKMKELKIDQVKPQFTGLPTPSMILSGLYQSESTEIEKEKVSTEKSSTNIQVKKPKSFQNTNVKIQVASFSDKENAEELALVLEKMNFKTEILSDPKTTSNKLLIVPQPDDEIEALMFRLKELGYEGIVINSTK